MHKSALLFTGLIVMSPPLSSWLESTMTTHMAVQIPILVMLGWHLGSRAQRRWAGLTTAVAPYRWSLLILATCTLLIWMIPRLLDLAVERALVDLAKMFTLIFAAGMALNFSWVNLGPVARGIFHVEVLASAVRVGWIYLESPARLCTQYGLGDQQRLGNILIGIGVLYGLWLAYLALLEKPLTPGTLNNAGTSQ